MTAQLSEPTMERRVSNRLPIERDVRYSLLGPRKTIRQVGFGKTINMSRRGVLFTTESDLPLGKRAEVAVSWPAQLNDGTNLKLVIVGILVRADRNQAAILIEKHEFKTRGMNL